MIKIMKVITKRKIALIGVIILFILLFISIFAPLIANYDPMKINPIGRLEPPNSKHWFGTDNFGRDIFSRAVYGSRLTLVSGFGVVILSTFFGVLIGITSAYFKNYGVSIYIGIGIPIPILDEDIAKSVSIKNRDIQTTILDYGVAGHPEITKINYAELQSGSIIINKKKIRTAPLSSIYKARIIANKLKDQIIKGVFEITTPVQNLPTNTKLQNLEIRGDK